MLTYELRKNGRKKKTSAIDKKKEIMSFMSYQVRFVPTLKLI